MKRVYYVIACVCAFLIGMCAPAHAQSGTSCYNAIQLVDKNSTDIYSDSIKGSFPKTIWYKAKTFDLPLSVYFIPENPTDEAPEIVMDFGCTPGVYSDPLLSLLFSKGSGLFRDQMPHKPILQTSTVDGQFCYYLTMGKSYRDMLLKFGIDYNVEVFVKVTYHAPGKISIAPNDMFSNCMDGHKFMHLGDSVTVQPLDVTSHVVVPYIQWQDDSIQYIWNGTAPVDVIVHNTCNINPATEAYDAVDYFIMQPQDTIKMTSDEVKYYIQSDDVSSEAGMFYAKFYTSGTGKMKIERVPQDPPQGGATLLKYDRATAVTGDTAQLFAISYTWTNATWFTTPTDHIFKMYVDTTHDFYLKDAIASYQFHATDTCHWLGLLDAEMQALWTNTQDKYLYIRFQCTAKTTVTPSEWTPSSCTVKAKEIKRPSSTFLVKKGTYQTEPYYRFYYRDWKGGDMTFDWQSGNSTCPTFVGKTCTFPANGNNANVLDHTEIDELDSWTILAADLATMEGDVDEDGYLYVRFNPGYQGTMTVSTTAPEEEDPAPIVYPAATISVECAGEPTDAGQQFTVSVSEEQDLHIEGGEQWHQSPNETHALTLSTGVYTLVGAEQSVQIEVK